MDERSRNSISDIWGARTAFTRGDEWPERQDFLVKETPQKWVQSCCVLCSNGCALDVAVTDNKIVGVRGRTVDKVNHGRLGPKGLNGWIANDSPDRLKTPLIRKNGRLEPASWEDAWSLMVNKCKTALATSFDCVAIYNSGQLYLEDYVALSILSRAGLRTNNIDGNTRMCTATAAQALKETFGSDGQPGSYDDLNSADCIFLAGHNPANTQTVLWSKILDRLAGSNPPRLMVLDPRRTETARCADVHLAPRNGTNLALLNGLLHLLIKNGHTDRSFISDHTVGYEALAELVQSYIPSRVEEVCGIPQSLLHRAAELLGNSKALVSTVLQGIYQSHQATAAACQLNNLHLIRGMIGKDGCGILQMNGQPTAQNTREVGCDGDFPGFLNFQNPDHMAHLANWWNVDLNMFPHEQLPTDTLEIFRKASEGIVKWLWVIGTNPTVSLPELQRIRNILLKDDLFLIVQDAFMSETCELADLVLPTAMWSEKIGTFTNADRTVHIAEKAIDPPGIAESDFEIFCEFSKRMGFKDRDGQPLLKFEGQEAAFDSWRRFSNGLRPDYSGISYQKLREGSGIQWPCNSEFPDGCPRLYSDQKFPTALDDCQSYGHDLKTGKPITRNEYELADANGKARIKACDYTPPPDPQDEQYPFLLTTGRNLYHFHTRTKTGRVPDLQQAAPIMVIEIATNDADKLGIKDGDVLIVASRAGSILGPCHVTNDIIEGHIFIPFHYGHCLGGGENSAANELTRTSFDPISKQPSFKYATVQIHKATASMLNENAAVE